MMIQKTIFGLGLVALFATTSCSSSDDDSNTTTPPRDVTEVRDENDVAITDYLKTHFYVFDSQGVSFGKTENDPTKTALINQVKTLELDVLDADNQRVRHKLYYLIPQEGSGKVSSVADSVYVAYKGQLLDGTQFDKSVGYTSSNWLDLLGNTVTGSPSGSIRGFREGVALLKDSNSAITEKNDGSLSIPNDGGVGVFFIPSGLGYFNLSVGSIPAYTPLIFVVNLIKTKNADHDNDGIPSINEITRDDYGVISFPNCDGDSYPDYLDSDKCN